MSRGAADVPEEVRPVAELPPRVVLRRSRAGALVGCLMLGAALGSVLWLTWPREIPALPAGGPLGLGSAVRLAAAAAWLLASAAWLRRSRFEVVLDVWGVHDGWQDAAWSDIEAVELVRVAGVPMLLLRLRDERRELQVPLGAVARDPAEVRAEVEQLWRRATGRPDG